MSRAATLENSFHNLNRKFCNPANSHDEPPRKPEVHLHTPGKQPEQLAERLMTKLTELGIAG
jgi:hypothetical protein